VTVSEVLDSSRTPDGKHMILMREGGALTIFVEERLLMSSRLHGSEDALAEVGCEHLVGRRARGRRRATARVLVGGLGLGYTLRRALDLLGERDVVEVAELMPAIVRWHREGPLGALAGRPLDDPRSVVVLGDLGAHLRAVEEESYDAMLLDVDNGPEALSSRANRWLYGTEGLARIAGLLAPRGRVVFWSAFEDRAFAGRLAASGLDTRIVRVGQADRRDRQKHVLFVGART
jgi:predicted membrane-bound spermidine synthase